jgi:hypothetical protein
MPLAVAVRQVILPAKRAAPGPGQLGRRSQPRIGNTTQELEPAGALGREQPLHLRQRKAGARRGPGDGSGRGPRPPRQVAGHEGSPGRPGRDPALGLELPVGGQHGVAMDPERLRQAPAPRDRGAGPEAPVPDRLRDPVRHPGIEGRMLRSGQLDGEVAASGHWSIHDRKTGPFARTRSGASSPA